MSGFFNAVTNAAGFETSHEPDVLFPILSVLRNSGELLKNRPWDLSSANLVVISRDSWSAAP